MARLTVRSSRSEIHNLKVNPNFNWPKCCGEDARAITFCDGKLAPEREVLHVGIECKICGKLAVDIPNLEPEYYINEKGERKRMTNILANAVHRFRKL